MAAKRTFESYQGVVACKKLKSESDFKDDKVFSRDTLTEEMDTSLEYDFITNEFGICLRKQTKETVTLIKFSENECDGILKHFSLALKVIDKYTSKRSSKPIDIPFETVDLSDGHAGVIMFIKENSYKRGSIQIDLRRCIKRVDGTLIYTKEGVRMNSEVAPLLRARLQAYKKQINDAVDETRKFIVFAQVCLIIQEIDGLYHQHDKMMGYRRALDFAECLSNDTKVESWSDIVHEHWHVVVATVSTNDACALAERAITTLPNATGLVYSESETMADPEDSELKRMVMEKHQLLANDMYMACVNQLAE